MSRQMRREEQSSGMDNLVGGGGNEPQFHNANSNCNAAMEHHHEKSSGPQGHNSMKPQMNPFFSAPQDHATGQMPSQKQRYLDAMMLSSVGGGGNPNRSSQTNHPDPDEVSRRADYDSTYATNAGAARPEGGEMNYRNLRAIQLHRAPLPTQHQQNHSTGRPHVQAPPTHNLSDKDSLNTPNYCHGGSSQDRSARPSSMPPPSASHGNYSYHKDVTSDGIDRRVSSSSMPSSVRSTSRENNSNNTSPHPMMPGGYHHSQHVHDHDAYNYYMANNHGSHANSYYGSSHYPIVLPEDTQEREQIPFNNNGNIPYYPDNHQRPHHPYSYMLGNVRHQDKRARHAYEYDTMSGSHDYSNFAGHQQFQLHVPPPHGFSRSEQDMMMDPQQGGALMLMLPSFNDDLRPHPHPYYSGVVHPHHMNMGMEAPPTPTRTSAPIKPVKTKKRYPGDMPRRPLTAYNFFFSEEREIILAQLPDEDQGGNENLNRESDKNDMNRNPDVDVDVDKILSNMRTLADEEMKNLREKIRRNTERMLKIHKESDRVKKSHKKVHGKIAFQHLAKIVGQRWRNLHADERKYYEDLASKDLNRYNEQLDEYNKKKQEAAVKKESQE